MDEPSNATSLSSGSGAGCRERTIKGNRQWRLSRSEGGSLDFDSSPVLILLAEQAKHVGDEEN